MPRKLRVEYEGAIYHVMNRGDRREAIFLGDPDRRLFVQTLGEVCLKTCWQVHACCLMSNHFHLVVETPEGNLVAAKRGHPLRREVKKRVRSCFSLGSARRVERRIARSHRTARCKPEITQ